MLAVSQIPRKEKSASFGLTVKLVTRSSHGIQLYEGTQFNISLRGIAFGRWGQ